jgi:cyanophycin synthetase
MIQTIQGLNLESELSKVIIPLQGNNIGDVTQLLDKVSSFHSIFMYEYLISPEKLVIASALPFLWREAGDTLIKLSKQEITFDKAYEIIVNDLIKKRIKSMSTISLLNSCIKKNVEITPTIVEIAELGNDDDVQSSNRYYTLGCGKGNQITCSAASTKDAYIAQKIQRDKWATNCFIERMQLALPKWELLPNKSYIEKIWDQYSKPLVIKPVGLTAGMGVTVGINTIERAKQAYDDALQSINSRVRNQWQTKIMIQEQVKGEDYRLLVIDGKLEAVTKRIPAFIIGDGNKQIIKLIEDENSDPRRDILNPSHTLKPIKIDKPLNDCLKDQNLTLDSIPQKDEQIFVRKVASMSQGGITQDFTDSVSKEIKATVESIAHSIHAFTLGVDVMCLDISKPLTKDNGAILEVNTMPEIYLNLFPVLGQERSYIADIYIDKLLRENRCQRIVVIGQSKDDIPTLLRKKTIIEKDDTVGEVIEDRYLVNGMLMNSELEKWRATEAIKCNSMLDVIILHYRNWKEVQEYGLGFNKLDTVYITKDQCLDKEKMKILKRYKRKKLIDKIKRIE